MPRYIADSYLYRAIGADINGACGKCGQSRSDCMCHSLSRMDICGIIEDAPTADVVERKRGKWEMKWHVLFKQDVPCCSVCHKFTSLKTPYCGLCGADMRGEEE